MSDCVDSMMLLLDVSQKAWKAVLLQSLDDVLFIWHHKYMWHFTKQV